MEKDIHRYKLFGRRKGRKKNLDNFEKNFLKKIITKKIELDKNNNNILDIGSGSGENSLYLSKKFMLSQIIACEKFEDGNLNLCKLIKVNNINNILIFNGNVLEFFDTIKKNVLDSIWILFPDPWPKKRHHKRRLINYTFLNYIHNFLKDSGRIMIATDSSSYMQLIFNLIYELKHKYEWENQNYQTWNYEFLDLAETKFYKKALNSNRKSTFFSLKKI